MRRVVPALPLRVYGTTSIMRRPITSRSPPRRPHAHRLGRIRLREDPRRDPPPEISDSTRAPGRFHALLRKRTAAMRAVLLDQTYAAGVRNWRPTRSFT